MSDRVGMVASAETAYRPSIDGLRAVAVLAVVLYHARVPGIASGFLGVDVFFVISGFLITGLLWRELLARGTLDVKAFYERRIRRLLPALVLVVAASVLLGALLLTPVGGEQQGLAKSAIATMAIAANLYFMVVTGDYFDAPAESQPLLHTWSLSVEEQFYLVWPFLLIALVRLARDRSANPQKLAVGVLIGIAALSLMAWLLLQAQHADLAFFMTPMRAWEFAAGGLVYFGLDQARSRRFVPVLAPIGLVAIVVSCVLAPETLSVWGNLLAVTGTMAVLVGCELRPSGSAVHLLSCAPMVAVGKLSYSIYLWHWPLLAMARAHTLGELEVWGSLGICALAFLLAAFTYHVVEQPIRSRRWPVMATRRRTYMGAVYLSLTVVVVAAGLGAWAKLYWSRQHDNAELIAALGAVRRVDVPCGQTRPYSGALNVATECTHGSGPLKMVLWGDSHAAHLVPLLQAYARANDVSFLVRYMPQCPPLLGFDPGQVGVSKGSGCTDFNRDVQNEIAKLAAVDSVGVIMSAHWVDYGPTEQGRLQLGHGLEATLDVLGALRIHALLLAPGIDLPHRAPLCLARRSNAQCAVTRAAMEESRRPLLALFERALNGRPGVRVFDPTPWLCPDSLCVPLRGGMVLFSDAHHLSVAGVRSLLGPALQFLDWTGGLSADVQVSALEPGLARRSLLAVRR